MGIVKSKSACKGKTPYASRQEAQHVLRNRSHSGNVKAYKCPACGYWHIGHRTQKSEAERQ